MQMCNTIPSWKENQLLWATLDSKTRDAMSERQEDSLSLPFLEFLDCNFSPSLKTFKTATNLLITVKVDPNVGS